MSMENQVTVQAPSVISDMATRFGMDKRAFEATIRATCMPSNITVSNEQFAAFLLVAKQYDLNPLTKEIYAFPAKGGGIQPIVGIDGWCNIINSHPQLNGITFEDKLEEGKIQAITCRIHRKDREHPVECTEYLSECGRDTQPWKQWPARMLRHKALIQCARYAFGFSGIVEQDEAERAELIDVTPQKGDHFLNEVSKAIREKLNEGTVEMAHQAAEQVAKGIPLKKTPFATKAARTEYKLNAIKAFNDARDIEHLEMIHSVYEERLQSLRESENEHDRFAVEEIDNHYTALRNRVSFSSREIAEDETTFDNEEVPAFIRDMDEQYKAKVG